MNAPAARGDGSIGLAAAGLARLLAENGIEEARREARRLVAHLLGIAPSAIVTHPEREMPAELAPKLGELAQRRIAGEPYSRIVGEREFWSLTFRLSPDTLDPRPDSETLIDAALAEIGDRARPRRLLDLGTGSGCLLLALLSELPNAFGVGIDLAPGAAATARDNARQLGLAERAAFAAGDWGSALAGSFDTVLVNPPYIPEGEIPGLEAEVRLWDPMRALAGGADGMAAVRALAPDLARLLAPAGFAIVELGAGQAGIAAPILSQAGLELAGGRADLAGIERCLIVRHQRG